MIRGMSFVFGVLLISGTCYGQTRVRELREFPDILGYETLLCDFHMHTVFSDGLVWPSVRPEEAWREGLDAIAITDHLEYRPHTDDMRGDPNRSFEIASERGAELNITVLHGAEITRSMPPGHANALFIENGNLLLTEDWTAAWQAAADQEAFLIWNHPGMWMPGDSAVWFPEHEDLYQRGWLQGIEIVNGWNYYPEAHALALEKGLTILANSDIHEPVSMEVNPADRSLEKRHRPLTLVLAKENSPKAIRNALENRRTLVYSGTRLMGEERYLLPFFMKSVSLDRNNLELIGEKRSFVQVTNHSEVSYRLVRIQGEEGLNTPDSLFLPARSTTLLSLQATGTEDGSNTYNLQYRVENCLVGPGESMPVQFKIKVHFKPAG